MWSKVYCLRKQHDGRGQASNHRPSDEKSDALITRPLHLTYRDNYGHIEITKIRILHRYVHQCRPQHQGVADPAMYNTEVLSCTSNLNLDTSKRFE